MVKCEIMLALLWPLLPPIISQKLSEKRGYGKNIKKLFKIETIRDGFIWKEVISFRDFQIMISNIPQLRWNLLLYRTKNNLNPCSVWLEFLAYGMQHISTDWYVHAMFSNRFDLFQLAIRKLVEKNREEQRILESRFNVNQTQRCQWLDSELIPK